MTEGKRRPGPRRALSENDVLDAALRLMDADGPAACSIRRIAGELGVTPNAVYTYFADKAAIEHALVERLLGEVNAVAATRRSGGLDAGTAARSTGGMDAGTAARSTGGVGAGTAARSTGGVDPLGDSGPWRREVELLALEIRGRLVAHPGAVPLFLSGAMNGPQALVLGERLLELLERPGKSRESAARASYLIMVYVLGAIGLEVADQPHAGALPPEADRIAARAAAWSQVPGDMFPRTAAVTGVMAAWIGTDQYLWGLHRVLDGL